MELRLNAKAGPGGSIRKQLEQVWEQTGKRPAELVENELPEGTAHIWEWFLDLHRSRTSGAMTANPIPYSEILAWSTLTGNNPTPWEVGCLAALDAVWLNSTRK